jgi:citrate synthase
VAEKGKMLGRGDHSLLRGVLRLKSMCAVKTCKPQINCITAEGVKQSVMGKNTKEPFHWRTSIAYKTKERIVVRGYDNHELVGNIDFASMMLLVLTGNLSSESQRAVTNALLVSLCEHAFSPSSAATRFVISGGAPLNAAVAAGILSMGTRHASADIPARMFQREVERCRKDGIPIESCALEIVKDHRDSKMIFNGFYHPQHIEDPRVHCLFQVADQHGTSGDHQRLALAIEKAKESVYGRIFYLNGTGALPLWAAIWGCLRSRSKV